MVNRTHQNTARHTDNINARKNYASDIPPSSRNKINNIDDLIAHLSNARENRRARQVGEWECMRQVTFRTAA